jgi:hypothetical protein
MTYARQLGIHARSHRGFHGARTRRPEVIILGAAPGSSESMEHLDMPCGKMGSNHRLSVVLGTDALPLSYSRGASGWN